MTFFKSSVGKIAAGYLDIPWEEGTGLYGVDKADNRAFLLGVDDRVRFNPSQPNLAVNFLIINGPNFG